MTFINKMRLKSLHWTPSQTLMHVLVDSGYLKEYKVRAVRCDACQGSHFWIG